ncbi:MAG: hypothetical protein LBE07_02535 [Gordonia sp. (in: high G+C Gram-positive bacteria)]|nr:hypothetical protein [Gordonia sp. (in: high G+C Gram-positive bacteria)]
MRAHLLDRQIIDGDGRPAGVVDDVVFELPSGDGRPRIVALLTGRALVDRILGDAPEPAQLTSIGADTIDDIGVVVTLTTDGVDLGDVAWVERWMRDHVIARIPGSRRKG